jgi:UDP:flavonoid glycosyltransferase YjiC (YdhE family)
MDAFPAYLSDDKDPYYNETVLTAAVNEAIASFSLAPIRALPQIYTSDDEIVASIPLLDCYQAWRKSLLVPPVIGGKIDDGERRREEVFIYLSTTDRFEPTILTAVASLRLPVRVVLAGNPTGPVALMHSKGLRVETQPLAPREIARTARVIVHAGNHGLTCLGFLTGIPQVTLAEQAEHRFDGRRVAEVGVGINLERNQWTVPAIHAAIREVWESPHYANDAITLSRVLNSTMSGEPGQLSAERIDRIIH